MIIDWKPDILQKIEKMKQQKSHKLQIHSIALAFIRYDNDLGAMGRLLQGHLVDCVLLVVLYYYENMVELLQPQQFREKHPFLQFGSFNCLRNGNGCCQWHSLFVCLIYSLFVCLLACNYQNSRGGVGGCCQWHSPSLKYENLQIWQPRPEMGEGVGATGGTRGVGSGWSSTQIQNIFHMQRMFLGNIR